MKRFCVGRRGQIWIETVIYTLIGIAIIGLVLTIAKPRIDAKKDEVAIEQALEAMGNMDGKIRTVFGSSVGNRRKIDLEVSRGDFVIDMAVNQLKWVLDSSFEYSELDTPIRAGAVFVTTTEGGPYEVTLKIPYGMDIQFDGIDEGTKVFSESPTIYELTIENEGRNDDGVIIINFMEN